MNEHFLHFAWKNGLYNASALSTTLGLPVEVIDPGQYNRNSGPDFLNARIKIDGTEWAGNVEIHYRSSMWNEHRHQLDNAYNNVILHVIIEHDRDVYTASGTLLPAMALSVNKDVLRKYQAFMLDTSLIVCRSDLALLDRYTIRHCIHTLAVERLQKKVSHIQSILVDTGNDWEETLYILIAENFGLNINKEPFGRLVKKVPLKLVAKHSDNSLQVEALFFGQAGFLSHDFYKSHTEDEYFNLLLREYTVLKAKYKLKAMEPWEWKFHRMRPANFPTIRISQLASLLIKEPGLFAKIKESYTIKELLTLLSSESSIYWHKHYRFGKESGELQGKTGRTILDTLIINSVIPLIFSYGRFNKLSEYCDRALDLSDLMPAEKNRISREWLPYGVKPYSALESQGLIELTNSYCKNRLCLNCHIGTKLISLGRELDPDGHMSLGEPE